MHQGSNLKKLHDEIQGVIDKTPGIKKLVIVSTHAFIGDKIQKLIQQEKFSVPIFHALIVTDDSAQRFWMVPADITFVPSYKTKKDMETLYTRDHLPIPQLHVAPYPINPHLIENLDAHVLFNKIEQLDPTNPQRARICIPVSGAAVQLDYYKIMLEDLTCPETTENCREFTFSVITREGNYTRPFIHYFRNNPQIIFHIGANDVQTVELYDQLYEQLSPPAIEITKPSEQCFKVLTTPNTKGGPLLLLTEPVGRQEYDNLDYLERFGFLPSEKIHRELYEKLSTTTRINITDPPFAFARHWRALKLPSDPHQGTKIIMNGLRSGLFLQMQNYQGYTKTEELAPNGVAKIWSKIAQSIIESEEYKPS
jgi:hypothetical protein